MLANWVTLSRFPLLVGIIWILYHGSAPLRLAGVGLLVFGLMLDTVDGMVARRSGQSSLFGAVLDIAIGTGLLVRATARRAALASIAVAAFYLAAGTLLVPALWLDPFGALLKVIPAMVLAFSVALLLEER